MTNGVTVKIEGIKSLHFLTIKNKYMLEPKEKKAEEELTAEDAASETDVSEDEESENDDDEEED